MDLECGDFAVAERGVGHVCEARIRTGGGVCNYMHNYPVTSLFLFLNLFIFLDL